MNKIVFKCGLKRGQFIQNIISQLQEGIAIHAYRQYVSFNILNDIEVNCGSILKITTFLVPAIFYTIENLPVILPSFPSCR